MRLPRKETALSRPEQETQLDETVVTQQDIDGLLALFYMNMERGRQLLAAMLNGISRRWSAETEPVNDPIVVTPSSIDAFANASRLFGFTLHYPDVTGSQTFLDIYRRGGVLLPREVQLYMGELRRELTQTRGHRSTSPTVPATGIVSRLETIDVDRITLANVLAADAELGQDGLLVDMFWDVYSFFINVEQRDYGDVYYRSSVAHLHQRPMLEAGNVMSLFVTICRWYEFMTAPGNITWLEKLREEIAAGTGETENVSNPDE